MIIIFAIRIVIKIQSFMKIINFSIFIEKKDRSIELIVEFLNNVYKDINIFLRFIFANDQNKKFQFKNDKIENLKILKFIFFEFFSSIKNINIIFDFILKIIFATNFYHRVHFVMRFDLN